MRDIGWGRSSRCTGGDCIEVGWVKSSACDTANSCFEVKLDHGVIYVRDSKQTREDGQHWGPVQVWELDEWRGLLGTIKVGWRPDGVYEIADGCVEFGLECHDDKLSFDAAEWAAFVKGVINEEFEPGKLSSPADGFRGSEPSAGRNGLDTGQASSASEVRHGHDPASDSVSRVLPVVQAGIAATGADTDRPDTAPVAAQPACGCSDLVADAACGEHGVKSFLRALLAADSLDDELDHHLYSSAPAVAEERPVTGDRSEAGTGSSPGPVPAAEQIIEAARVALCERVGGPICPSACEDCIDDANSVIAAIGPLLRREWEADRASPIEDANEWAKAIAPLVPTDGVS